ncbi:nuclear transport factor 2 family protein [Sphingomonas bacterium]|uniref:nuclear transport factor 2 family protein n=1 Tax=Sphingomonas bacterium TaxID=1895847 RepID=UPI001575DCAA|nr:nuclear transport factor 2 family protein [Sphingomonas bacterium]
MEDRTALRDMVENWAVWRDSGQWDKLLTLWHEDSVMSATWQQSSGADFVAGSRAAWTRGVDVQHFLGGTNIELAGDRAVIQTKMTIGQRSVVHDVLVDVTCEGRFYDCCERRAGRWGIVWRQPIYERDRMDPVAPDATLTLDQALLDRFPVGYRHLGYLQTQAGMTVKRDMPGRTGPEIERLYARGAAWLAGRPGHPADPAYLDD